MATVLWCYLRNNAFKKDEGLPRLRRPHRPGQPPRRHHPGRHHQAEAAREQRRLQGAQQQANPYGKLDKRIYTELTSDHPIDLCRYQVANCYMGRAGLINSGGASRRERPRRGREDRRHQQARRRHGPDLRPQGLPAPDDGGRQAAERHPGRLPLQGRHGRVGSFVWGVRAPHPPDPARCGRRAPPCASVPPEEARRDDERLAICGARLLTCSRCATASCSAP